MDSSSDVEMHQTIQSPPRRRRSTFFEKNDLNVTQTNVKLSLCNTNEQFDAEHRRNLQRYYQKLLNEKEQWRKELRNRKHKYMNLKQKFQMATKASSKRPLIKYDVLTKEDIEFLNAKPNLPKFFEDQAKFHQNFTEIMAIYRRTCELDDIVLSHVENKNKKLTKYTLDHSDIEGLEESDL